MIAAFFLKRWMSRTDQKIDKIINQLPAIQTKVAINERSAAQIEMLELELRRQHREFNFLESRVDAAWRRLDEARIRREEESY